jgi:hypothetical protein
MKTLMLLVLVLMVPMLTTGRAAIGQNELTATVVEIYEWREYVPQPIIIVGLNYAGKKVESGESFLAARDWTKDLSVRVKNVSDQTLKYIEVVIEFPRDEHENPTLPQVSLWKGFPYIITAELPTSDELSLAPDQEVDLSIAESSYKSFELNVKTVAPSVSILHSAKVKTEAVAFGPNRIWMHGAYLDRDPKKPTRWIVDREEVEKMIRRVPKQGGGEKSRLQTRDAQQGPRRRRLLLVDWQSSPKLFRYWLYHLYSDPGYNYSCYTRLDENMSDGTV